MTLTLLTMGNIIEVMDVQPGDAVKPRYGAAVDVGTTSLVVYLVNIHTGKIEDIASSYNPQVRCGEDVISLDDIRLREERPGSQKSRA